MEIKSTKDYCSNGVNILVYGQAGAGKTSLIKTLDNPIILSSEAGLLSIKDCDIPYIEIRTISDFKESLAWLSSSNERLEYKSVAIDSLSEISELILEHEKRNSKDARMAYGEMTAQISSIIRAFRDFNKTVYMTAKLEKSQDETGRMTYSPSIPGNKTSQLLPYFFDEVLALRVETNKDGESRRALMCDSDGLWQAKDRSGKLDKIEPPNLSQIIKKIEGK
jgi:phage nucleotide-binding protein